MRPIFWPSDAWKLPPQASPLPCRLLRTLERSTSCARKILMPHVVLSKAFEEERLDQYIGHLQVQAGAKAAQWLKRLNLME